MFRYDFYIKLPKIINAGDFLCSTMHIYMTEKDTFMNNDIIIKLIITFQSIYNPHFSQRFNLCEKGTQYLEVRLWLSQATSADSFHKSLIATIF